VSRDPTRDSQLLIDAFLPRYDFAVVHASVLPAPPEACYRAALGVDLLRDPVIRTLLGIRSLPQRLADRLARRHHAATAAEPPPTFRLGDKSATAGSSSTSSRTSSSSSDRSAARGSRLGRRVDQRSTRPRSPNSTVPASRRSPPTSGSSPTGPPRRSSRSRHGSN
jgi:hypothetical protein